jgi:asparagine synthase (glutamine-hydrolysing)
MCGICGIAATHGRGVPEDRLTVMREGLVHRGPDSAGSLVRPGVGLACRRLAIIDLLGGDQPIANEAKTAWIVLNGEIYNFPDLRRDLEKRGHTFRTHSDTECILHLYEDHGDDCVAHLRGMFAFALWDTAAERLLLARDRLGKKPIYYTQQDGLLYFSSELPSLLSALPQRPGIDYEAIDLYLAMQYIPDPWTPFEGVFRLPAAHRLILEKGELHLERYWQLRYLPKWTNPADDLIEELRLRVADAVACRLTSEVPLGAHLSGGLDSSIVVALMAEASAQRVKTFSIGFEQAAFSEVAFSRAVAERYATEHHEFVVTYGDVATTMRELVVHLGEPLADPSALALYHLSRLTRQHVTVALNGDGGDEAFAGYQRYWLDPWANRYLRLPALVTRGLIPGLARRLPAPPDRPIGSAWLDGLKRLEQLPEIDPRASLLRWGSYFSPGLRSAMWREPIGSRLDLRRPETLLTGFFEGAPADTFLDRTLYADISTYLPGDLLVKADRMTMAWSLEGRSPFLDHELMSWAARLPETMRVRGRTGKVLLRKAFAHKLPPEVLHRGKQGFGLPVGAWFRGPLAAWAREVILGSSSSLREWFQAPILERILHDHLEGQADHGKRLWALVVLGLWADRMDA